jgi:hypothetical protein
MIKKILLCASVFSVLAFASCNKNAEQVNPVTNAHAHNPGANAKSFWGWLADIFFGPSIDIKYKSGYYESTGPGENDFKCNPGDGVCELEIHASARTYNGDSTEVQPQGWASATMGLDQNGRLTMVIYKTSMTSDTYTDHYSDGYLSVPNDWVLQSSITSALNLQSGYTVPAGNYPIDVVDTDYLVVRF